jgi:hypothetical protein
MKVELDQFQIRGDKITHEPTGAVFWKGERDVVNCDWGTLAVSSARGDTYDRHEIMERACEIFVRQRARPLG